MPTYDSQCRSCGVISEVVHSMLEDGPTTCERCGGELRRLVHPTGIIFKGSGFYKTDSRSSSGSASGASRSPQPSSAEGGSPTTSTDSASKPKETGSTSGGGDAAKGSTGSD